MDVLGGTSLKQALSAAPNDTSAFDARFCLLGNNSSKFSHLMSNLILSSQLLHLTLDSNASEDPMSRI